MAFTAQLQFEILNYDVVLPGENWHSNVMGKIVDELNVGIGFASLTLTLLDGLRKPTTVYPYSTVSDITGSYSFDIDVNFD